jgi:hypothetical protein
MELPAIVQVFQQWMHSCRVQKNTCVLCGDPTDRETHAWVLSCSICIHRHHPKCPCTSASCNTFDNHPCQYCATLRTEIPANARLCKRHAVYIPAIKFYLSEQYLQAEIRNVLSRDLILTDVIGWTRNLDSFETIGFSYSMSGEVYFRYFDKYKKSFAAYLRQRSDISWMQNGCVSYKGATPIDLFAKKIGDIRLHMTIQSFALLPVELQQLLRPFLPYSNSTTSLVTSCLISLAKHNANPSFLLHAPHLHQQYLEIHSL